MKEREHQEQCQLMRWLELQHPKAYEMTHATPNGGHRHKAVAAKLKKEGCKAGYPDLTIDIARGGFYGLRIEFKASPPHSASTQKNQLEWLNSLSEEGYCALLCKGFDSAKEAIHCYLSKPLTARE